MQIKTKPRYHFLPNILANSKNLTTYTIGEALGKQALSHNSGRKTKNICTPYQEFGNIWQNYVGLTF